MKRYRLPLLASVALLLMVSLVRPTYGEEEERLRLGFSALIGFGEALHDEPDHTTYGFFPRLGWALRDDWDVEVEGNFSRYDLRKQKDFYFLGASFNFLFKPVQGSWGSLFLLVGGGLGYDNGHGDVKQLGDSSFGGILQGGMGIQYNLGRGCALRGEYRFLHLSEPFRSDRGLNEHGILLGLAF